MVTRSHTQLKEDEIKEDLSVYDISEPHLKNFCGKQTQEPEKPCLDTAIKIQCISTFTTKLQKNLKVSTTF